MNRFNKYWMGEGLLLRKIFYRDDDISPILREIVDGLPVKCKIVIILKYGLEDGKLKTLAEVANELHLSRERVRQIEAKALRILSHPVRQDSLLLLSPMWRRKQQYEEKMVSGVEASNIKDIAVPLEDLNIPTRLINALRQGNIKYVHELKDVQKEYILSLRNVGKKSWILLQNAVRQYYMSTHRI